MTLSILAFILSVFISIIVYSLVINKQERQFYDERIATMKTKKFNVEKKIQDKKAKSKEFVNKSKQASSQRFQTVPLPRLVLIACPVGILWYFVDPQGLLLKITFSIIPLIILSKIWQIHRLKKYRRSIEEELPSALDLLVVCVEAGMSINTALLRVAGENKKSPLSSELRYTFHELNLGVPSEDAFHHLGERTGVDDVQSLTTAIVQSERLGISLGETMRNQSKLLRETIRLRTREKVLKLPVKMMIPIAFFIFPSIFTVILAPAVIQASSGLFSATQQPQVTKSQRKVKKARHQVKRSVNKISAKTRKIENR